MEKNDLDILLANQQLLDIMKRKIEEVNGVNELNEEEKLRKTVKFLKEFSDAQPKQKTKEWFSLRRNCMTASDAASCLKKIPDVCQAYITEFNIKESIGTSELKYCNPYSNENEFILKKNGHSKFEGNVATQWGVKYETAACRFYESLSQDKVLDFGLMFHKYIDWLACSPDGITEDGRMLEIKCPYKRTISGIPPIYYWIQCQFQLEVCDLDICDFIECKMMNITLEQFTSLKNETIVISKDSDGKTVETTERKKSQGLFVTFKDNDVAFYPPRKFQTRKEMLDWAEKKCEKYSHFKPEIEYYRVHSYTLVTIKRNKEWFNRIKPMLEKTWTKVKNFKYDDYSCYLKEKKNTELINTINYDCPKLEDCIL